MREDLSIYLSNSEILLIQYTMIPQETQEKAILEATVFLPYDTFSPK